jgi:small subunit ribosomal protein S9
MAVAAKIVDALGTGRRKTSVARVRIRPGTGKLMINERTLEDYFTIEQDRNAVVAPLEHTGVRASVDVVIRAHGGGSTGQAGACMQGIARALMKFDSDLDAKLREKHFLTRDARMKERKKPGLHGARRGTQFSKR